MERQYDPSVLSVPCRYIDRCIETMRIANTQTTNEVDYDVLNNAIELMDSFVGNDQG